MFMVTLEGLPHSGRARILRNLAARCPDWHATNVRPDPMGPSSWASATCRTGHSLFAALMRKVSAIGRVGRGGGTLLLNSQWFEHLPHHPALWALMADTTRELVATMHCHVDLHVMIMLHVHHDETFEQMVCSGNPSWNMTGLADVREAQEHIGDHLESLATSGSHPFPCVTYTIRCPPFFDENEVVAHAVTQRIVDIVHAATGLKTE